MYTHQVYNNGYPVSYGNVITVGGSGGGQLLLEWSGADKGIGHVFYRNRRDCIDSWSDWRMLAFTTDLTWSNVSGKPSTYTPPAASSSTLGGIKMSYGTNDLSAGSSSLATGALYFVYE